MMRQRTLSCLLIVLAGCVDRQVDDDDDYLELRPTCMILPARGYWEDGSSKAMFNELGGTSTVCLCMTEDEMREQTRVEELNDLAYAECKRIEGLYYNFDWTDCQESYESGEWLFQVFPAIGEMEWTNQRGLDCDGNGESDESCSITDPDDGDPLLALVFVALLGLRRRDPRPT